jgi:hypothetical protein
VPAVAARAADDAPSPAGLVDACRDGARDVDEVGPRACRSAQSLVWGTGQLCRVPDAQQAACGSVDGRDLTEAGMTAYEGSWTHRALALQRELDARVPLLRSLVPHTHNSFNSVAYPPTVSGLDANQAVSLTDQLRLDMRGIELDVHWAPSPTGNPADGGMAPIMCHGEPADVEVTTVHAGCTVERHLRDGLAELRRWLTAEEEAGRPQLVVLYLENALDDDPTAHAAAAQTIDAELGGLVLRTPEPCAPMPLDMTRQQIIDGGRRVLIVGNCGPGAWGSWVHERGPHWDESSSGPGDDYRGIENCAAERADVDYANNWVRRYEDSTWLSAMAGGASSEVTATETGAMVRCGVNMPGFDQLRADDVRLAELVWSWAPDEPVDRAGADCAAQGADARFHANPCTRRLRFACVDSAGGWHVTSSTGRWNAGPRTCARSFPGSRFAVPANGFENGRLRGAAPLGASVWLDYRRVAGDWTPGITY